MPAPEVPGIHLQGGQELGLRALEVAQVLAGDPQQPQGARVPGLEAQRLQQPGLGLVGIVPLHADQAHELERPGIGAVQGQGLPQRPLGLLATLLEHPQEAQVAQRRGILGVLGADGGQAPGQVLHLLGAGVVAQGHDPLEPQVGVAGVLREGGVQHPPGLLVEAPAVERPGEGEAGRQGRPRVLSQLMKGGIEQPEPLTEHCEPPAGTTQAYPPGSRRCHRKEAGPCPPGSPGWRCPGAAAARCAARRTSLPG